MLSRLFFFLPGSSVKFIFAIVAGWFHYFLLFAA